MAEIKNNRGFPVPSKNVPDPTVKTESSKVIEGEEVNEKSSPYVRPKIEPFDVPVPDTKKIEIKSRPLKMTIKVKAIKKGWYGNVRLSVGQEFTINSEEDFSSFWMKKI